jgi:hypothetical protein
MATADDSEKSTDNLSERINANGWRVIGNATQQPDPGANELKSLIRTMQDGRRQLGKCKVEETEPPKAA